MSTPDPVPEPGVPDRPGQVENAPALLVKGDHNLSLPYEAWLATTYAAEVADVENVDETFDLTRFDVVVVDFRGATTADDSALSEFNSRESAVPLVVIADQSLEGDEPFEHVERLRPPVTPEELETTIQRLDRRTTYRELLQMDYRVTSKINELKPDDKPGWLVESAAMKRLVDRKKRIQSSLHELEADFSERDYAAIFAAGFQ